MKKVLRSGFTSGACVAAGVKAALFFFRGNRVESVDLLALDETRLTIPIKNISEVENGIRVEIVKDSGDDPDVTNGVSIFTTVRKLPPGSGIQFKAGVGVGIVTRAGLQIPVGEPAINPKPRELIRKAAGEFDESDLEITVEIPDGVELSKKTLNHTLGIEGGLSILGTTGVLRPMSEDAFKNSLVPKISIALAAGFKTQIFVPGKIGENLARKYQLKMDSVVETSNFIGFMLDSAVDLGVEKILLLGHIGKLAKVASGSFQTHNRVADGRLETIAAYSAAGGMDSIGVQKILESNTTEDAVEIVRSYKLEKIFDSIASRASLRASRYVFGKIEIGTCMSNFAGEILGIDSVAKKLMEELHE